MGVGASDVAYYSKALQLIKSEGVGTDLAPRTQTLPITSRRHSETSTSSRHGRVLSSRAVGRPRDSSASVGQLRESSEALGKRLDIGLIGSLARFIGARFYKGLD